MLKYKADIFTLVFVFTVIAMRATAWALLGKAQWWLIPLIGWLVLSLLSIKHNHVHSHIFKKKWANRIYEHVLNVGTGVSSIGMLIIHILNHHREVNSAKDWGTTHQFKNNWELLNLFQYSIQMSFVFARKEILTVWQNSQLLKKELEELLVIAAVYSCLLFFDPINTLIFVFGGNLCGQFIIIAFNYIQHNGCDEESTYNHSVNLTGKWLNFFVFNTGYHTIHHLKPSLHWSILPKHHREEVEPYIEKRLLHDNTLLCLWTNYIKNFR